MQNLLIFLLKFNFFVYNYYVKPRKKEIKMKKEIKKLLKDANEYISIISDNIDTKSNFCEIKIEQLKAVFKDVVDTLEIERIKRGH